MGARKLSYNYIFSIQNVQTKLPNRHKFANDYRYGFQGQELNDEIKGG